MLAVAGAELLSAAPASALRSADALDPERLGLRPAEVRDRVVLSSASPLRALRATRALHFDARYSTGEGDGHSVRVVMSDRFAPDPAVPQSWASFLGSLLHDEEILSLTVILLTREELDQLCPRAVGCYFPASRELVTTGEPPRDGTPLEEVATHEYGHHVARERDNRPWHAIHRGTKRWATYERICARAAVGEVFPGDQAANYALNPGEAFADSYRILNGGNPGLWQFDRSFFPDATDMRMIRADVLTPWSGPTVSHHRGRFTRRGGRSRWFSLRAPLDGDVRIRLVGPRGADFDLFVHEPGEPRPALQSTRSGRYDAVAGVNCGGSRYLVQVFRHRGAGRFRLIMSRP